MPNIDLSKYSEAERKQILKILKEYSETGTSSTMQDLLLVDYKEYPVDIETFITDDNYLGKAWKDAAGTLKLYPF